MNIKIQKTYLLRPLILFADHAIRHLQDLQSPWASDVISYSEFNPILRKIPSWIVISTYLQ